MKASLRDPLDVSSHASVLHAHHAIQVVLCLEGTLRLHTGDGEWKPYPGVIVGADVPHSFDGSGATIVLMFMDPETREGAWLRKTLREPIARLPDQHLERCLAGLRLFSGEPLAETAAADLIASVIRDLRTGPLPRGGMDPRISAALETIRGMDASRIRLEEVAKTVFLSPSRFTHLFREEVGVPFRRYVLWRKFTRAVLLIGRGATLSAAAHQRASTAYIGSGTAAVVRRCMAAWGKFGFAAS